MVTRSDGRSAEPADTTGRAPSRTHGGGRISTPAGGGLEKAATWLTGGLVVFSTSLAAFGGLTGGIVRMFRNSSGVSVLIAIGCVLGGVVLAVLSLWRLKDSVAAVLLILSVCSFGFGLYRALDLMVASSQIQDRPTLSAQLTVSGTSGWVLKVQSSSSGLRAQDRLQTLVYAQPRRGPSLVTPSPLATTPGTATPAEAPDKHTPRPSPVPTITLSPIPTLDGDRLLFAQAGPNVDGVASQNFEVPIPADRSYRTVNVTAVIGEFPRNCEGVTVNVRDFTEVLVPPERIEKGRALDRNGTLSCLTIALPSVYRYPSATPITSP